MDDEADDEVTKEGYYLDESLIQIGEFKGGLLNGNGQAFSTKNIFHEGTFVDDKLTGKGKVIFSDRDTYE
jgi:hypothetical protein